MVCLNTNLAGINIKIGVSDMIVLAMPAAVYCTAISEKPTPIRGPQITATTVILIPLESLTELAKPRAKAKQACKATNEVGTEGHIHAYAGQKVLRHVVNV